MSKQKKGNGHNAPLRSTLLIVSSGPFSRYLLLITNTDCTSLTPGTSRDKATTRSIWA